MDVTQKIQRAGMIIGGLGLIGFLGVIWLMIFGNLSGNLGFGEDTQSFTNQTITVNGAYASPATVGGKVNPSLSSVIVTNATCVHGYDKYGCVIGSSNYTIVGGSINVSSTSEFVTLSNSWNVTGTVTYDSEEKVHSESVISNMSRGFTTFFGFSGTFFTIAAIVLLIFMLVGLLAVVWYIGSGMMNKGKDKGFSGY